MRSPSTAARRSRRAGSTMRCCSTLNSKTSERLCSSKEKGVSTEPCKVSLGAKRLYTSMRSTSSSGLTTSSWPDFYVS
eukprot:2064889-Amphidinium_carterae.2